MAEFLPSSAQGEMPGDLRDAVRELAGANVTAWRKPDTGLSRAQRYLVTLTDGQRVFVKAATDATTADWLRNEHLALTSAPARFVPRVVAWRDEAGVWPLLLTEALEGHWPASHAGVNWRPGDLELLFAALRDLAATPAPKGLAPAPERLPIWPTLRDAAGDLDSLDLAAPGWLAEHIPALAQAEASLGRNGTSLVHGDMRSDNICILEGRAVFVDWTGACRGSAHADLANFLAPVHLEGGPRPFEVMPDGGAWAAAGAAENVQFLLRREAPVWLQQVIKRLARINLAWAAECLALPPPNRL